VAGGVEVSVSTPFNAAEFRTCSLWILCVSSFPVDPLYIMICGGIWDTHYAKEARIMPESIPWSALAFLGTGNRFRLLKSGLHLPGPLTDRKGGYLADSHSSTMIGFSDARELARCCCAPPPAALKSEPRVADLARRQDRRLDIAVWKKASPYSTERGTREIFTGVYRDNHDPFSEEDLVILGLFRRLVNNGYRCQL
jgi:hypothetical protein